VIVNDAVFFSFTLFFPLNAVQHGGYIQEQILGSSTPVQAPPAAVQYVQPPTRTTPVQAPGVVQYVQPPTRSTPVKAGNTVQYMQQPPSTPTSNYSPPIFEQIFKNARFAQGGNALFEGRLKGTPMPEVSWTRKGAPLFDSNKHRMTYNQTTGEVTLMINQIGPGDEGEYTCRARNAVGEAICSVFIQPEGFAPPQFQQRKEVSQSTQQQIHQQQQQRLYQQQTSKTQSNGFSYNSVEEEFKVDTFEYRLLREVQFREQITHRYAGESDTQLSTVVDRALGPVAPPLIQVKPRNSKLIEGTDAVFSMKVASNPKPRMSWFHNGHRIIPSEAKHEMTYSNNQATLRIKTASASDSGHYTLLAENTQGCVVSSAVLAIETVQELRPFTPAVDNYAESNETAKALAPSFIKVFQERETQEGKMTRFDCRVTGRPYPEVTWYINQNAVNDDATHKILVNESGNHSLMITNVSRFDGGIVTCVARNKSGEVSTQAGLTVLEKEQVVAPKFVERFTTVNVREGEPVRLNARAVGTPVPRITWQKDGAQVVPNDNCYIGVDGGATALDIPQAMSQDAGWYQCTAQNVAGSTATRARLFVETSKQQTADPRVINFPKPTRVIEPE
jgi:titin